MKLALALVAALAAIGLSARYETGSVQACGIAGPFDFDTYEAEDYIGAYGDAIELVTSGTAVTTTYTVGENSEVIDLRYQGLKSGPRSARTSTLNTSLAIPPTLYKSIVWIESNYTQAAPSVAFGGVGPALRSFDCGYGLGQITSGMSNGSGTPAARQALIGTHYLFNVAEGVRILADKWNSAPGFRPIAGQGNPAVLEDWYYAVWSYNGFAFSNHPLNPIRDPLRGGSLPPPQGPTPTPTNTPDPSATPDPNATPTVTNPIVDAGANSPIYHCFDKSAPSYQSLSNGQPMFGYGDYTYPERVYGCVKYPPSRAPVGAPSGTPATIDFWDPIAVSMPDFTNPVVSAAFDPQHFIVCENGGFSGGCPAMDFPTSAPGGPPIHTDPTGLPSAAAAAAAIGAPSLVVNGPKEIVLAESATGVTKVAFSVENAGTGVAPFRIRTSADWIVVHHANDSASRTLDGGVAVGSEIEVVTQQASAGPPPRSRIAQAGYHSQLVVTANPNLLGAGEPASGTIWIEPLLGGGAAVAISVSIEGHVGVNLPFRQYLPWISSEPTD